MEEQKLNIVVEHYDNDELAAANEALADAYFSFRGEYERVVTENAKLRELVRDMWTCVSEGEWDCSDCPRYAICDEGVSEFSGRMCELGFEVE